MTFFLKPRDYITFIVPWDFRTVHVRKKHMHALLLIHSSILCTQYSSKVNAHLVSQEVIFLSLNITFENSINIWFLNKFIIKIYDMINLIIILILHIINNISIYFYIYSIKLKQFNFSKNEVHSSSFYRGSNICQSPCLW